MKFCVGSLIYFEQMCLAFQFIWFKSCFTKWVNDCHRKLFFRQISLCGTLIYLLISLKKAFFTGIILWSFHENMKLIKKLFELLFSFFLFVVLSFNVWLTLMWHLVVDNKSSSCVPVENKTPWLQCMTWKLQ